MTEGIATQGSEAQSEAVDQAAQLLQIVEQMRPEVREQLARALGVKPVRKKPVRQLTNEDIKRQALMVGEVSHGEDFQPAFSEGVTQAIQQYPRLQQLVLERWAEGQPISHSSLEFDPEIQELILREKPVDAGESSGLMERMGADYVQATEGEDDTGKGLSTLAKEEFPTDVLEQEETGTAAPLFDGTVNPS